MLSLAGNLVGFLSYFILFSWVLTVLVNFIFPINWLVSLIVLVLSFMVSYFCSKKYKLVFDKIKNFTEVEIAALILFVLLGLVFVFHPTLDIDANVYHLPLALIMNKVNWYPGVINFNAHAGVSNGSSVIASLFTSTMGEGGESIGNLIIWFIMGVSIYCIGLKIKLNQLIAFGVAVMVLFTPDMFWQAFNMGNDLPASCFIFLGFWCWKEDNIDDAGLFFALSSIFKLPGLVVFGVWFVFVIFTKQFSFNFKTIISGLLVLLFLFRQWVGTGNPFFPAGVFLPQPEWALPVELQEWIKEKSIRNWSGVDRSAQGIFRFIFDFIFNPKKINSSYWFTPVFFLVWAGCLWLLIKKKIKFVLTKNTSGIICAAFVLFAVWFYGSPLFRFITGIFIFLTMVGIAKINLSGTMLIKKTVSVVLLLNVLAFLGNSTKHVWGKFIPTFGKTFIESSEYLPFSPAESIAENTLKNGEKWYLSSGTSCGWIKPPCLGYWAVGDKEKLAEKIIKKMGN